MTVQESTTTSTGLAAHLAEHPVPPEQLRFAVVLNGGVSLAVWMGGVVLELDRLTKALERNGRGSVPYALMLRLTGCTCRADVISGSSAGGINGAALALTQVNREADPSLLRDLWTEQGRIESLLRPPFRGQPTSLLQGDEYFLPRLHTAMEILAKAGDRRSSAEAPIDLTITTTVLKGNQTVTVDSMGQQLPQRLHAGRFHWRRDHPGITDDGRAKDPFDDPAIRRTAHRLALAARASASFPFAFEPTFIPVGAPSFREPSSGDRLTDEVRLRPDMGAYVESWGDAAVRNRSRYVIDGGLLANTPTLSALEAIERMPAEGPVRRVMLLVFPHAPEAGLDPEDRTDEPPTVTEALTGLFGALSAQGSRTYVDALERHNLAAAGRRGTRTDILQGLADGTGPRRLKDLCDPLFEEYKRLRRRRAARDLAAWRTGMVTDEGAVFGDLPATWNFERVRSAAQAAQDACAELPYVPSQMPDEDTVGGQGWGWGVTGAIGITEAAADLLRRMVWVMQPCEEYDQVRAGRQQLLVEAEDLRRARMLTDRCWREQPALTRLPPDQSYWTLRLACYDHLMLGRTSTQDIEQKIAAYVDAHRDLFDDRATAVDDIKRALQDVLDAEAKSAGQEIRHHVDHVVTVVGTALRALDKHLAQIVPMAPELKHWHRELMPDGRVPDDEALLLQLVRLEIVSTLLGEEVTTGASLPVELVQVSAQTEVPFAKHTVTGDDKLGGMALARFGGFLKRSWRVNDWMWGRVDGATALCRTVLDPERIRRAARLSGYVQPGMSRDQCRQLAHATLDGVLAELGDLAPDLAEEQRTAAVEELVPVFDLDGCPDGDLPSALTELASLFATAIHRDAVPAELPALARAVRADRVDGANPRSRGEVFVAENQDLLARLDAGMAGSADVSPTDRTTALEVFDRAGIGREPLQEETSSDLVIRTGSTAAAVISTVVDSDRSGLTAIKPVTRAVRGAMLLPYWAITGLTSRQALARSLALLGLSLGGVLLALSLFDALPEGLAGPAAALGAGALLAAFAYAALRTGSLLHSVVLLTPVIPLVAFAVTRGDQRGGSIVVAVVAVALGLMLLGSMGFATSSVWASLDRVARARGIPRPRTVAGRVLRRLLVAVGIVVVALLVVGAVVALVRWVAPWAFAPERVTEARSGLEWLADNAELPLIGGMSAGVWGLVVVAAVLVVASVIAHYSGRRLQVLAGDPLAYEPVTHADAVAAGWSVLYGTIYLLLAWVLTLELLDLGESWWRGVAFATAVLFAVALLLVVPVWLPWRAIREARRDEAKLVRTAVVPAVYSSELTARRQLLAGDLVQRRVGYRCFVRAQDGSPALTPGGQRLEQRLHDCRAAVALRSAVAGTPLTGPGSELRDRLAAWREHGLGTAISKRAARRADALRLELDTPQPDDATVELLYAKLLRALDRDYPKAG